MWGVYYGILLMLEKYVWGRAMERLPGWIRHAYAFLIVVFGFVIFAITDMGELGRYIGLLFSFASNRLADFRFVWYLRNYGVVIVTACVLACPVYPRLCEKAAGLDGRKRRVVSLFAGVGVIVLFLLSTAYMVSDTYNPFLYFRF